MTKREAEAAKARRAESRKRYEARAYRKFLLRVRTDGKDGLTFDQVERAAKRDRMSVNAWIVDALRRAL